MQIMRAIPVMISGPLVQLLRIVCIFRPGQEGCLIMSVCSVVRSSIVFELSLGIGIHLLNYFQNISMPQLIQFEDFLVLIPLLVTRTYKYYFYAVSRPHDTPFEDGTFKLTLEFTEEYPNKPPTVKFVSKMFHPNVYADGGICLDILQNRWSPTYDVAAILTSIQVSVDALL